MQFWKNKKEISFKEFSSLYPRQAKILSKCDEENWQFIIENERLKFIYKDYKPIFIDILNILESHRIYFYKNSFYKEPLAKALGLKKGKSRPSVLDATAGFMGDTLLMSNFDLKSLTCMERYPIAQCLIMDALTVSDIPIDFDPINSADTNMTFDVCFFDPMYSEKNKKTAPKKEMLMFREIIGEDLDSIEVAKHLLNISRERLVIKRSVKAGYLLETPSHSINGKSTRYDVYLKK